MSNVDTPSEPGQPPADRSLDAQADASGFDSFLQRFAEAPAVAPKLPKLGVGSVVSGTYRVESELGAGGMGVVFRATDLRLKRSVALKVHTRTRGEPGLELLRVEARALAHLTHPNVVQVFEVGVHQDRLFIAMEFVDGGTLDRWHVDRSWREILEVYLKAAEGLAAAHRAGLVHRDFKPANVLMGRDGRPRVADFGLVLDVSIGHGDTLEDLRDRPTTGSANTDSSPLVGLSAHAMVGTPRYMAPEQAEGRGADHRADQYALCSALFEALTGDVPMDDVTELPTRPGVPPAVWQAITKGLAQEPKQRHESVDRLLEALRLAARPRKRWMWMVAAAAVVVGVAAGTALYTAAPPTPQVQCQRDAALTVSAWQPARARLQAALRAGGDDARADAFAGQLDDYASRWLSMRQEACDITQDQRHRDASMRCLGQGARAVQSVLDVVGAAPPAAADAALRPLPLPSMQTCALDRAAELSRPAPAPGHAAEVDDVGADIATANALIWNGDPEAARALALATLRRANQLDHAPTRVAALLSAGDTASESGQLKASHTYFEQAFYLAQSLGYDEEAGQAAGALIEILSDLGDTQAADRWVKHATASFDRVGDALDPADEISLLSSIGLLRADQGRYTEALRVQQQILSALPEEGDEVRRSKAHNSLGGTYYGMGKIALAIEHMEAAIALNTAARGPDHPDNIYPLANLAWILIEAEELDRAEPLLDRAITLLRDKTADDAHALATLLSHRGSLHDERGEYEEALRAYAEGLAVAEAELGDEHEVRGLLLNNQAVTLESMGQVERARGVYAQAVRVLEQTGNPNNDGLVRARESLARLAAAPPVHRPSTGKLGEQ